MKNLMQIIHTKAAIIQCKTDSCRVELQMGGVFVGSVTLQPEEVYDYLDKLKEAFEILSKPEPVAL